MKFSKLNKILVIISGIFILILLNYYTFYLLQESISISDALEHAESDKHQKYLESLQSPSSDFLIDILFIIDVAFILLLLILIFKFILKLLKTSITQHQISNIK